MIILAIITTSSMENWYTLTSENHESIAKYESTSEVRIRLKLNITINLEFCFLYPDWENNKNDEIIGKRESTNIRMDIKIFKVFPSSK